MAGKLIVYAPNEYMGIMKLHIFINGVDQEKTLKRGEKFEFTLTRDSVIEGKVSNVRSVPITVKEDSVTEISFSYLQRKGTLETLVNEISKENYVEEEKPIFYFDGGVGDKLAVYEDRIVLMHKGALNFMAMGVHGDKIVYYSDLTGIQYKRAGFTSGHIQFSLLGSVESKGGIMAAASDENTITFTQDKNKEAEEVYQYLNNKLRETKTQKNTANVQVVNQVSAADELKKFKELLDAGIITQEEFDTKKKQLLGL